MFWNEKRPMMNASKRLPIVFCLDVSPSMGWRTHGNSSSIDLLNAAVSNFLNELRADAKVSACTEVALVTFSSAIKMDTSFESISTLKAPKFRAVWRGGTNLSEAVLRSIEKIENHRKELENNAISYYAPFLVIITDGDPDGADDTAKQMQAVAAVKKYCESHVGASEIIVPFVIGVGDHISSNTLNEYAAGFTPGYFPIRGTAENVKINFQKAFKLIGNSVKKSINLNGKQSTEECVSTIQPDMEAFWRELVGQ